MVRILREDTEVGAVGQGVMQDRGWVGTLGGVRGVNRKLRGEWSGEVGFHFSVEDFVRRDLTQTCSRLPCARDDPPVTRPRQPA